MNIPKTGVSISQKFQQIPTQGGPRGSVKDHTFSVFFLHLSLRPKLYSSGKVNLFNILPRSRFNSNTIFYQEADLILILISHFVIIIDNWFFFSFSVNANNRHMEVPCTIFSRIIILFSGGVGMASFLVGAEFPPQ